MLPARQRYVLPDLRKLESDLVVEVPFRLGEHAVWIYILLEHQSEPDRTMPLRLLGYMVELWKAQVRRFEENKTPDWRLYPILPVLFYTGSRRWSAPLQLEGLMDLPEALAKYVPRFETLFLSLQETSDEELSDSALGYGLLALREADAPDATFEQALRRALAGIEGQSGANQTAWEAVLLFVYQLVVHHREPRELNVLVQLADQELTSGRRQQVEEILMTGAEALIQQGVQQGEIRTLQRQIVKRFGANTGLAQSQVARLSSAQLDELTDAMFDLPDLQSLESWLVERVPARN